jgi:hypothetical protein
MSGTLHGGEARVGGTRAQAEKWSGLGLVRQGVVWDGTRYDVVYGMFGWDEMLGREFFVSLSFVQSREVMGARACRCGCGRGCGCRGGCRGGVN